MRFGGQGHQRLFHLRLNGFALPASRHSSTRRVQLLDTIGCRGQKHGRRGQSDSLNLQACIRVEARTPCEQQAQKQSVNQSTEVCDVVDACHYSPYQQVIQGELQYFLLQRLQPFVRDVQASKLQDCYQHSCNPEDRPRGPCTHDVRLQKKAENIPRDSR